MSIFKKMVELQHQFNEQVIPNYLEKNLNWNSAIIAESGELLDSLGYKWWKKQEPDMENVKVESIDLLHFVISEKIQENYAKKDYAELDYIIEVVVDFEFYFNKYQHNSLLKLNSLIDALNYCNYNRFIAMKQIFEQLNMSNEDVYIAYITKNCLNKFRQNHGYKDGTYIKDWNGKEDNVVAFEIANKIGAKDDLFDKLYNDLKKVYDCCVVDKKEVHISNMLDDIPDYFKCNEIV